MWWSQLKSASIGFRFCVSNLSDSDTDLPCNHSLFRWIVKQLFIDVSAAAVLIPEMTSHCSGTCTILTTRYRHFIIVRMAWRRRCHAAQTRHDELMTSLTCGEGVVSCRVSLVIVIKLIESTSKLWRCSQYACMASWLCMCTVNRVVAFTKLYYSWQANLRSVLSVINVLIERPTCRPPAADQMPDTW